MGRELAARGVVLVCGGLGGVMEAACRGAKDARRDDHRNPAGTDRAAANPFVDFAIPTGLGEARNALVVRAADALIAVGGAYGTLSEIAFALKAGKPVAGLGTWDVDGVIVVDSPRPRSRASSAISAPRLATSCRASPTRPTSTRCARTPPGSRPASTCPATRAAPAPTPL